MDAEGASGAAVPGPSRSRRRYMPGSARSKTIELGTLSEVEEDLYQNRKDISGTCSMSVTQDDSCIGSVRRPSMGSVRSIARHLSEKNRQERISKIDNTIENQIDAHHSIDRFPYKAQTTRKIAPQKRHEILKCTLAQEASASVQRSASERRHSRDVFPKWSATPSEEEWTVPYNTNISDYRNLPPPSISRHPTIIRSDHEANERLSRSASTVGRMIIFDPRMMSLVDPRMQDQRDPRFAEVPVPVWFPSAPGPPVYFPVGPSSNIPFQSQKLYTRKDRQTSICCDICCGGFAQFLWTIICIILMGVVSMLIFALFYL